VGKRFGKLSRWETQTGSGSVRGLRY